MEDNLHTSEQSWPGAPLEQGLALETTPAFGQRPEPKVRLVLLVQLVLFVLFLLLGFMLFQLISSLAGWDTPSIVAGQLAVDAPPADRWPMRLFIAMNSPLPFVLSGLATVWIFYRRLAPGMPGWGDYLLIRRSPTLGQVGQAWLLLLVAMPLVLFLLAVSKLLPLPQIFHDLEHSMDSLLRGLLQMENGWELLANLTIIAFLPAFGEELVFRGVLQQQLMRRIANPWVAILVTATIFSAIHGQFDGFLSRLLLGFLLGWLYWRFRNFWIPVAAHFFNNGLQVLGQYLYHSKVSTVDLEKDIDVPWFAAAVSALLIVAVMRWMGKVEVVERV
ncbi:MAG: type II CAAX endopeptidase family protein [Saprospiraceae bacterium]